MSKVMMDNSDIKAVTDYIKTNELADADVDKCIGLIENIARGGRLHLLKDEYGNTALQKAVCNNHLEIADSLIQNGMDVNGAGWGMSPPLMLASSEKPFNIQMVKMLLDNRANVNLISKDKSPLIKAVARAASSDIIKLLLDNGADVNQEDGFGKSALVHAVANSDVENVKLLLCYGAALATTPRQLRELLYRAAWKNDEDIFNLVMVCVAADPQEYKELSDASYKCRQLFNTIEQNSDTGWSIVDRIALFPFVDYIASVSKELPGNTTCVSEALRYIVVAKQLVDIAAKNVNCSSVEDKGFLLKPLPKKIQDEILSDSFQSTVKNHFLDKDHDRAIETLTILQEYLMLSLKHEAGQGIFKKLLSKVVTIKNPVDFMEVAYEHELKKLKDTQVNNNNNLPEKKKSYQLQETDEMSKAKKKQEKSFVAGLNNNNQPEKQGYAI